MLFVLYRTHSFVLTSRFFVHTCIELYVMIVKTNFRRGWCACVIFSKYTIQSFHNYFTVYFDISCKNHIYLLMCSPDLNTSHDKFDEILRINYDKKDCVLLIMVCQCLIKMVLWC